MFVLMSKVTLEPASDELVRVGIAGPNAAEKLSPYFESLPGDENGVSVENNLTIIRLPGTLPHFEIIGKCVEMTALWQKLAASFTPVGSEAWQLLGINAAQPSVVSETVEMFIPQMLNLHVINGVSFKKGCYPGQEVVARLHYRGKLKRHMQIAQFSAEHCPVPGTPLYPVNGDKDAQAVGNIVLVSPISSNEFRALCVIANDFAVDNGVCLQEDTKQLFSLHDLPYDFPEEN